MLNADRFSGTQSQVHQKTFPQRYSAKMKKQNFLLIYSISSPHVHTCLMLLTKRRQCVVSKEEVIVSFFISQTLCECGALQSLNTDNNALISIENANIDNARNDNVEQIYICYYS